MIQSKLPKAILIEREAMLRRAAEILLAEGCANIHLNDIDGFPDTNVRTMSILNITIQPDIEASTPNQSGPTLASIEVSTDLGEEACGRRWQVLNEWAKEHSGNYKVFIHPEDQKRAEEIAQIWHLETQMIVPIARH